MGINNVWDSWLAEADEPTAQQAPTGAQVVPDNQGTPGAAQPGQPQQPPALGQQPQQGGGQEDNVEDDPAQPEMADDEDSANKDFEQWRHDFYELSIKGDVGEMMSAVGAVINREGLEMTQRRFVNDNMQILLYRQDANVQKATKEIRNLIKQDLDRTNPGTTVMQHVTATLEKDQQLQNTLIKMCGWMGQKGELHRKFMASILGAVQVGGGASRQDLMYFDKEYTINLSTRYASQFGEINLGKWTLKAEDPDRYLTEPEIDRLNDGSPEEKQTLRRRIIVESISEKFKERAFLIHVVHVDGTIYSLGWDLGDSLISAYKEGKIVVRGQTNTEKDAMISDSGEIVNLVDIDVYYVRETGETDDDGSPEMVEVEFLSRRNSGLYLSADLDTLRAAAAGMSGLFFHETPFNGNPAQVISLMQCSPTLPEILNKRCGPL